MDTQKVFEDARCRIFPATLSNAAQKWYFKFPPASIISWEMFVKEFYGQFYAGQIHPTEANKLVDIRKNEGEPLKEYIQRFMRATTRAKSVGDEGKMMGITAQVQCQSPLWSNLRKNGVKNTPEFLDRADKYIKLEEAIANDGKSPKADQGKTEESTKAASGPSKPNNNNNNNNNKNGEKWKFFEEMTSNNKHPKENMYKLRFTNHRTLVDSRAEVY
ncbi:uncharacterized protein LOC133800112 [Humulus lupulus]|uniref:uncharacterized protein LOC133800112 n=1 Tax=Humulus lupulus TaxID=3486 RepID=UPI002B417D27|nr:uncharacterized protein LOC133800112 [Humulus lupulus]